MNTPSNPVYYVRRGQPVEARFERLARHEREVRRAAAAARITDVERRALAATAKAAAFGRFARSGWSSPRVRRCAFGRIT